MTRRTTLAVAAALALTALPACGDRPDDTRAQIEEAVNAFNRAAAAGDAKNACSRLTGAAREQLDREVTSDGATGCEAAIREVPSVLSEEQADGVDEAEVRRVRVNGDRAEVADEDLVYPASVNPVTNATRAVGRPLTPRSPASR